MKRLPSDDEIRTCLRRVLPQVYAGYVFGSIAAGEAGPGSDIDIAVLLPRPLPALERFAAQEAIAREFGRDVDLIDLRAASTVLRMQVLTRGRLLFSNDEPAREAFEDNCFSAYARLNEERAAILEQIAREGGVHGG